MAKKDVKNLVQVELNEKQEAMCLLAFENTLKGEKAIRETENNVSAWLFGLAKDAAKIAKGKFDVELAYFTEFCKSAERQAKAKHKVDNLKDVAPHWSVYKSQAISAYRMKLSASPFKYLNEFKLAGDKAKADREASESGSVARTPIAPTNEAKAALAAADAAVKPLNESGRALSPVMDRIMRVILRDTADWTTDQQERFAFAATTLLRTIGAEGKKASSVPVGVDMHKDEPVSDSVPEGAEEPKAEVMQEDKAQVLAA